jgi:hypothetical protein
MITARRILVILGTITCIVIVPHRTLAADYPNVGNFQGSPEDYQIKRNGQRFSVTYQMAIYDGDMILVKQPSGSIRIDFGKDAKDQRTICAAQTTQQKCYAKGLYTVATSSRSRSGAGAILRQLYVQLTSLVTPGIPEPGHGYAKGLGPHSDPYSNIEMPLATTVAQKLVSGKRNLLIVWGGGAPPFQIYIYIYRDLGRVLVIKEDSVMERRTTVNSIELLPGADYSFTIADSRSSFDGTFSVVQASGLPTAPAELADPALSDDVRDTAVAAWLWRDGGSRWRWEAYLRVAAVSDSFAPAKAVRDALEKGESLPND